MLVYLHAKQLLCTSEDLRQGGEPSEDRVGARQGSFQAFEGLLRAEENSSGANIIHFEDLWACLEGDFELEPTEQSFEVLADENGEYLDLQKA